jgi:hypothetical protein
MHAGPARPQRVSRVIATLFVFALLVAVVSTLVV